MAAAVGTSGPHSKSASQALAQGNGIQGGRCGSRGLAEARKNDMSLSSVRYLRRHGTVVIVLTLKTAASYSTERSLRIKVLTLLLERVQQVVISRGNR